MIAMKTIASKSRCTISTRVRDRVRAKIAPWMSANGRVSSGPHSR